jgi:hypothetical protein
VLHASNDVDVAVNAESYLGGQGSRPRVCPCGICGGQSCTGTGVSPILRVSPVSIIPPGLHTHISCGGWTICSLGAAVQRQSKPVDMNSCKHIRVSSPDVVTESQYKEEANKSSENVTKFKFFGRITILYLRKLRPDAFQNLCLPVCYVTIGKELKYTKLWGIFCMTWMCALIEISFIQWPTD